MTSKERMMRALNREKPDRLPVSLHQWQKYHLDKYLGGMNDLEAFEKFGFDAQAKYFGNVGQTQVQSTALIWNDLCQVTIYNRRAGRSIFSI